MTSPLYATQPWISRMLRSLRPHKAAYMTPAGIVVYRLKMNMIKLCALYISPPVSILLEGDTASAEFVVSSCDPQALHFALQCSSFDSEQLCRATRTREPAPG